MRWRWQKRVKRGIGKAWSWKRGKRDRSDVESQTTAGTGRETNRTKRVGYCEYAKSE